MGQCFYGRLKDWGFNKGFQQLLEDDEISCLSFDCDGTLINSMNYYWKTWDLVVRHFGLVLGDKPFTITRFTQEFGGRSVE